MPNVIVSPPVARGPIAVPGSTVVAGGWVVSTRRSSAGLRLCDASALAKVFVTGSADGVLQKAWGVGFRSSTQRDGALVVGSGPGEWLLLGAPGAARQLTEQVRSQAGEEFVTTVDVTHGRALMRLTGDDAARMLSKVCAVDVSNAVTPDRAAFRTSVAKVSTDVVRDDLGAGGSAPSYLLHCERSSGQYLFDCLLDAGKEFGIEPAGSNLDGKDA